MTQRVDQIAKVESFIVSIPRDVPYLGPLRDGESVNAKGYIVRKGNRTIYPTSDMSVVVKISGESGKVGWGETYGIVAPEAVTAIIEDVLGPVIIGLDPADAAVIHEDLYDLMRVRGHGGGYYGDALAGVDIAVWDLFGKAVGLPVSALLGGRRHSKVRAYASGLPKATLKERCDLAVQFVREGIGAIKFAGAVSDGAVAELAALREAVGPDIALMVDLHWQYTASEALELIQRLLPYKPAFVEAACAPEDIQGQIHLARHSPIPVALGEEWRTIYEALPRFEGRAMGIVQPEMGHTGITEFARIGTLAQAFHMRVMPHATIGCGIFMAASLQASAAQQNLVCHEYQHSIFDRNLAFSEGEMACSDGFYTVPTGAGIGVEPKATLFDHLRPRAR